MAKILGLPKLSPTMEEGVLVRWVKREGERVAVDDLLAEVETDKATMEFRAFDPGVLLKLLVNEGTALAPDQPVAILGEPSDDIAPLLAKLNGATSDPIVLSSPPVNVPVPVPVHDSGSSSPPPTTRTLASPLVRKRAREQNLDLSAVRGTGPRGRIILRDLSAPVAAVSSPAKTHPAVPAVARPTPIPSDDAKRVPLTSMRRTVAKRLVAAKREAPHFYLHTDVNAEALLAVREELKPSFAAAGEKLSLNDLVMYALARALRAVPSCNVSFAEDAMIHYQSVHLAMAVSVEGGLVTPVLRDADRMGLLEMSRSARALAEKARNRQLKPEEMEGGTCSISNLGMFGVDSFSAILNPPQACIVSVGAVRDLPVVRAGAVVPGKVMTLGLSCDHRAVDGAEGAKLLSALRERLERPLSLLL